MVSVMYTKVELPEGYTAADIGGHVMPKENKQPNDTTARAMGKSLEYLSGDGVEMETWVCTKCEAVFDVPIEIDRKWSEAEEDANDGRRRYARILL